MANQDNDNSFKLNIGGPSIILLLTVLGLSVFAILAIRASYNGLKLARTSASSAATYYAADSKADEVLYSIRKAAHAAAGDTAAAEASIGAIPEVLSVADGCVIYEVPVSDGTVIHVELAGEDDYSGLTVSEHRFTVENDDEYDGGGFDIEEIILF